MAIKIFAMNDCDWMAAETLEQASAAYKEHHGGDAKECEPHELSEDAMNRLELHDPDKQPPVKRKFREELNRLIADGQKFPCFFASTEY